MEKSIGTIYLGLRKNEDLCPQSVAITLKTLSLFCDKLNHLSIIKKFFQHSFFSFKKAHYLLHHISVFELDIPYTLTSIFLCYTTTSYSIHTNRSHTYYIPHSKWSYRSYIYLIFYIINNKNTWKIENLIISSGKFCIFWNRHGIIFNLWHLVWYLSMSGNQHRWQD